jgi:hypothetical protein
MISETVPRVAGIGGDQGTLRHQLGESRARAWAGRALDSPVALAVSAAVLGTVFVVLRTAVAGHGNIAAFAIVGRDHVHGALAPGVPVVPGTGYDGQFYYRLALDPLAWGHQAFGITFDAAFRISRIAYPAVSWAASGGHGSLVPDTLVAVNVAALAIAVGTAAALARDAGRSAAWGLVVAGYWGYLWTLARDLTELLAGAALLGALLAIRRRHFLLAGLALAVSVLTRETALVLVGTIALARLWGWVRAARGRRPRAFTEASGDLTRTGPGWEDAPWLVPAVVFVAYQGVAWARTGSISVLSSDRANRGAPFAGLVDGIRHYVAALPQHDAVIWWGELFVLVVVVVGAAWCLGTSRVLLHERLAWVGYAVLAVLLQRDIWQGDVGLRSLDDLFLFSGIVLLHSRRRLGVPAALVGLTWGAVFVELIRTI